MEQLTAGERVTLKLLTATEKRHKEQEEADAYKAYKNESDPDKKQILFNYWVAVNNDLTTLTELLNKLNGGILWQ